LKQPDRGETTAENGDQRVDRNIILRWLKEDIEYLRHKAKNDNPGKSTMRVQLLRASIYGCSVLLSGMKDVELDRLMEEIEEIKLGMKENVEGKSSARSRIH
jgi:hypothetical protein